MGGPVTGICMSDGCKGQKANGTGVDSGLSQLSQMLGQLMGKLMQQQQQPSAAAATPAATTGTTGTSAGCTSYYPSSVPSSDPCAYYVPNACTTTSTALGSIPITVSSTATPGSSATNGNLSVDVSAGAEPLTVNFYTTAAGTLAYGDGNSTTVAAAATSTYTYTTGGTFTATLTGTQCVSSSVTSSSLTSGSDLLNSLGGSGSTDIGSLLTSGTDQSLINLSNTNTNTNTNITGASTTGATSSPTVQLNPNVGGAQGNIQVVPNGATIVANTVDTGSNSAVAGFYGADTLGAQQPTSLVAQLCQNRPWAGNFLSYIIPPSFFDGLCQWQGYTVGTPPAQQSSPQSNVTLTQQSVPATSAPTTPSAPTVQPQVQIWAVPASVPLGARTTIDWAAQGVSNCTETSPDGSFSQNSLQGSAATVPLTGATTFTISCQAPDGTPVTDYVTVNIAI
jgi:hypothetical protein